MALPSPEDHSWRPKREYLSAIAIISNKVGASSSRALNLILGRESLYPCYDIGRGAQAFKGNEVSGQASHVACLKSVSLFT